MVPQHVHMSTGFLFVLAIFILGFIAIVCAFVVSMRREKTARIYARDGGGQYRAFDRGTEQSSARGGSYAAPMAAAAPVAVMHSDPMSGLATGLIVGSMLNGGHHTTVVHDGGYAPDYAAPSDGGFSWDSGGSDSGSFCGSD